MAGQGAGRIGTAAGERPTVAPSRRRLKTWLRRDRVQQPLFVLPACIALLSLTVYPFVYSVYLSLHHVRLTNLHHMRFVGLANYVSLLQDGLFLRSLGNTALLAFASISLEVLIGFTAAKVFFELRDRRWSVGLRSFYLMPMMVTPLTVGVMFAYLFNPTIGVVDQLLQVISLPIIPWFGKPAAAMAAILLISLWQNTPFMMLLILAALFSIPLDLYEAARMDGARWPQIVRSIEIPSVLGIVLLGVILRIIDVLRFFDVIYVTTRGGPGDSTMALTLYVYQQDFEYFSVGSGSAAAVIVLLLSIIVTTFAVSWLRRIEDA